MFGNKQKKQNRLQKMAHLLKASDDGMTQAELARKVKVSRSTVNKDLGIIQQETGTLVSEDEKGKLRWCDPKRW